MKPASSETTTRLLITNIPETSKFWNDYKATDNKYIWNNYKATDNKYTWNQQVLKQLQGDW
jgi:hypothetical protein